MSEHTPGPWEAEHRDWKGEPSPHRIYISGDRHESRDDEAEDPDEADWVVTSVAIVEGNATSREITEANARLIAAAPDLLAACKEAVEVFGRQTVYTPSMSDYEIAQLGAVMELMVAIAKAEGRGSPTPETARCPNTRPVS